MLNRSLIYLSGLIIAFQLIGIPVFAGDYKMLKAAELKSVLNEKDFFLMDVHIPEQTHITGTNAFIDYRKIRQNADKLPTDKNGKIVVYCRSGGMSRSAAYDLIDMGYTYVYDLEGGIKAFNKLP
ncbi:MAG: rhodanese-like domain-containing protein [Deltaproteobacteria bacterium]|nr:rhodanese-like domain-containing protein [Deltaproteobacteria bacterium]MBW1847234.1 rhodanese-like domain-containing protein [Deltaproteobacteria bacterium]MBW2181358.1 rhodanese-like domain-containing protein [Deltaproteobacteria bacterium]